MTSGSPVYIYALCEPNDTRSIRYVGKTTSPKLRLKQHVYCAAIGFDTNKHKAAWVNKLTKSGLTPMLEIIQICDESSWQDEEKAWIAYLRKQPDSRLVNIADGGQAAASSFADKAGFSTGLLKFVSHAGFNEHRKALWKLSCACGGEITAVGADVTSGRTQSCGCIRRRGTRTLDITGQRFGRLTALRREGRNSCNKPTWLCVCDCGKHTHQTTPRLRRHDVYRCGHSCGLDQ